MYVCIYVHIYICIKTGKEMKVNLNNHSESHVKHIYNLQLNFI